MSNSKKVSNINASTSQRSDSQAKSANPDEATKTIYLPKDLHQKLKALAVKNDQEISEVVEELFDKWQKIRGKSTKTRK